MAKLYVDIIDNDNNHETHSVGMYKPDKDPNWLKDLIFDLFKLHVFVNEEFLNKLNECLYSNYALYVPEDCLTFVNMEYK